MLYPLLRTSEHFYSQSHCLLTTYGPIGQTSLTMFYILMQIQDERTIEIESICHLKNTIAYRAPSQMPTEFRQETG